jgi:Protein of unknown function (DUF3309)
MTKAATRLTCGRCDAENGTTSHRPGSDPVSTLLAIILIILLIGALPSWPYSASWGYYPSGGLGTVLIIVVILILLGRI